MPANRAGERVEGHGRRPEAAPLECAAYGPGQEAESDEWEKQGDQRQVILVLGNFLPGHERRHRRDQVPEGRERPGTPHRRLRIRADRRRLPVVIQKPRGCVVLGQRRILLLWRTPDDNQHAEADAAENEYEDRLECQEAPADACVDDRS